MRILITGGGYAGLSAAAVLSRTCGEHEVCVIDRNPYATVMPLLPDLAASKVRTGSVIAKYSDILPENVRFIQAEVTSINPEVRTVSCLFSHPAEPVPVSFDILIITSGSRTNRDAFKHFTGRCYCIDSLSGTAALAAEINARASLGNPFDVLIIGSGYTAVEAAANLKHRCGQENGAKGTVHILSRSGKILKDTPETCSAHIVKHLARMDIKIHEKTELISWDGRSATAGNGMTWIDPVVVNSAGMTSSMLFDDTIPVQMQDGRIDVDAKLHVKGFQGIFAAGDAAALKDRDGKLLRRSVNFAVYSGSTAAFNAINCLNRGREKAFKSLDPGWVIPVHSDSYGKLLGMIPVTGRAGLRLHYLMCGLRNFTLKNCLYYLNKSVTLFD